MTTDNKEKPSIRRRFHMHLNVIGVLEWNKREFKKIAKSMSHDDGRPMSVEDARFALYEELSKGHKALPIGSTCEGFDFSGGGCPGHPMP